VIVELNDEILAKESLSETLLSNGDKVEIVHFVGGG
jgi:sulfur carrier protein